MSIFQVIMLLLAAFFAYKVYEHVQTLEDDVMHNEVGNKDSFSPFSWQELVQKADTAFTQNDLKRALALLLEADEKKPNNSEILSKLGYLFAQEKNQEQALIYLQKALHVQKDDNLLYNQIASVYKELKQFDNAKEALQKSVNIDDTYKITYYNYGNLLCDTQEYNEALKMYEKALKLDPDFKEAKEEIENIRLKLEDN